jgi:Holliday junction resolvase RusA-like endonuclease
MTGGSFCIEGFDMTSSTQNKYSLFIPIRPQVCQRPRFSFYAGKPYTPEKTKQFYEDVQWYLRSINIHDPLKGHLRVSFVFYFKKKKRGDLSNYIKAIEDAGNTTLWMDDKQIVEVHAKAVENAEYEGIEVEVERVMGE